MTGQCGVRRSPLHPSARHALLEPNMLGNAESGGVRSLPTTCTVPWLNPTCRVWTVTSMEDQVAGLAFMI